MRKPDWVGDCGLKRKYFYFGNCSCLQTRSALLANKGSFVPELTENKALLMLTLSENMPELSDNSLKTARPLPTLSENKSPSLFLNRVLQANALVLKLVHELFPLCCWQVALDEVPDFTGLDIQYFSQSTNVIPLSNKLSLWTIKVNSQH